MKILTVVYDLDKGGTQRAAQNFCEAYRFLGHDSQIIAVYEGGPRQKELENLGISCFLGLSEKFLQHLVFWQPDIVHLHSHALRKEEVSVIHKLCPQAQFIETNVFSCFSDYSENILDYSFQLSEWCRYLYLVRGGSHTKSMMVPNPVKTEHFSKASLENRLEFRKKYNIPENAFLLGRIGQKHYSKWSHYLIDIFERFVNEVNDNTYLVLVNTRPELLTYASTKSINSKIIVIDAINGDEELCNCYSAMDLFLHVSSQGESFGYALAESLLCETPVVTMNTPWSDNSQSEIVGHDIGGYGANSRTEFFDYVKLLFHNNQLRQKLGKQGREKIIRDYEYKTVAQNALAQIYISNKSVNAALNISDLPAIRYLKSYKELIVPILLWVKLRNKGLQKVSNFLLRRVFNHKVYY